MLKLIKPLIIVFLLSIITLQLWLVFNLQLFGDEAFYWLEGQNLAWSYAELPGWTAWMIRLGTTVFGDRYFAVRFFSFLSFISCIYASYLIGKEFGIRFINSAFLVSVPLFVLISTMALPDVWLVFFVLWLSYFFAIASKTNKKKNWVILGLLIALSLNVHVRMWIWLFFAGIAFVVLYYKNKKILYAALTISLPVGLIGLFPIIYFNIVHEFALFDFQFGRRHPWEFQLSNLNFFLSQFVVITPVVLFVWIKGLMQMKKQKSTIKWIVLTSLLHALFYLITTLFSDGLRTTVHWLLISYIPVLLVLPYLLPQSNIFIKLAVLSGSFFTLLLLYLVVFNKGSHSNVYARILDNSLGWQELSKQVEKNLHSLGTKKLIADYFMTAAELSFELNNDLNFKVLPHEKNIKHGRQKQLQIMDKLLVNPSTFREKALLVVEDSTLKLKNKGKYYQKLCEYFPQMQFIQAVNIELSNKQFFLFKINDGGKCEKPPLFYTTIENANSQIIIKGWVVLDGIGIKQLYFLSQEQQLIENNRIVNKGINQQFPEINDPNLPNAGYEVSVKKSQIKDSQFRLKAIGNNGRIYYSPIYYLN